jgi:hypothetical protein
MARVRSLREGPTMLSATLGMPAVPVGFAVAGYAIVSR